MRPRFRSSSLVPAGFVVDHLDSDADRVGLVVRSGAAVANCPDCGTPSRRLQSRYRRRAADLPLGGRRVELRVVVRRFWCGAAACKRKIFAERFPDDVLPAFARRTSRLEQIVHHLGLALGGRPGASLAQRLRLPVSRDTLLRVIRRRATTRSDPLGVIGIDDFAWRRNHRYGTLVCDLERRRIVALLPDHEQATAQTWLKENASIQIVARDRGGGYGEAIARALPQAIQVADRWHLMENASRGFVDAVRRSMRQVREIISAAALDPALLTAAERIQYEGYLRREEADAAIRALAEAGVPIRRIGQRLGHSRKVVRAVLRGERTDVFRVRQSSLEAYLPWLDAQWDAGSRNATEIWRQAKLQGFRGSLRVVGEWATRRRRAEQANIERLQRVPSARTLARWLTTGRDRLTKAETLTVATVEDGMPALVEAREVVGAFQTMVRAMEPGRLEGWLRRAEASLVASFARGIGRDRSAVQAAITLPWSNGQTEGQITKLKLVKRQMYGRGKIDLLQARLIGLTPR
ncbi:ISL3-like element ISMex24 family transposase [Methylorubrum extorquens]|uniref:ISL3 family transposase n=1 Tax=Methylorubrum extorquens TaxID=408 RepID=A0AAX3WIN1_METEX|nr:ISL3-like element ISMex24 family transposase [Methylorubrum extorquens]WHQ70535.1 ISL3 family transposase [Methylorubrum extorquens]